MTGRIPPNTSPGLVAVVAYDRLCTFEFGIAVEVFGLARPEFDFPWYDFAVVSADGPRCRATGGVVIEATGGLDVLGGARTIVLPGWRDRRERPPEALLTALRRAAEAGARVLTICSGVFVAAAAGLLDGRRATTHWRYLDDLAAMHPAIAVERDVLYVDDGPVISSAGSAAGIDACLHLVRRDFGPRVANLVARRLVMAPHREGGQAQYVEAPAARRPGRTLADVLDWARERLDRPLDVAALAARAAMSERTFLRRFREAVGTTPGEWLATERAARAKELLEEGGAALGDVAAACGFGTVESFRASFKRAVGVSPAAYRKRFAGR